MSFVSRGRAWLHSIRDRDHLDADLDDELSDWVDELIVRYEAQGVSRVEARRRALIETGGVEHVKDAVRDVRVGARLDVFMFDLGYAWRGLRKARALTTVVVITLALGIGANTAIFSVVNALLITPLAYRDPSQLVFIWSDMSDAGYPRAPLSGPELGDLRARTTLFSGFGAIWPYTASLGGDGDPEQLRIGMVTPDFFSVLGAEAATGRAFRADDAASGASAGVVLSAALWHRRYGGDPSIVGRQLHFDNRPATVIGVMPSSFQLLLPPEAGVPDDLQAWMLFSPQVTTAPRGQKFLRIVGRMRPGVSLDAARAEVNDIASRISREFAEYGAGGRVFRVASLQHEGVREIRPALLALFGGVVILLAIAAVNVASLLLARAAARAREIEISIAIGANRLRLFRRCLIEGLTLALLGGAAGLVTGKWVLAALMALRPGNLTRIASARIDWTVLVFTGVVSALCGILCSLAPLWEIGRADVTGALQRDGQRTSSPLRYRARAALVIGQIALGVVLLVCASLLARTFVALQRVDPGFRLDGVLTFRVALPFARYLTPEALDAFGRQLQTELARVRTVSAVGAISQLPYDHLPNWGGAYLTDAGADPSRAPMADFRAITPGFFETVDARLIEGHFFTGAEDRSGPPVVIVDDWLARRTWPTTSAVGRQLIVDPDSTGHPNRRVAVVGVVHHLGYRSPMVDDREQVYFPARQVPQTQLSYVLRTSGEPAALAAQVRRLVARLDPRLPMSSVRPFAEYAVEARATQRFTMTLAAAFAGVALLLACIGVYGVTTYVVTRRHREFGLRLALGAQPRQLVALVMGEGVKLAATGLTLGTAAAAAAAWLLRHQLFGVTPFDVGSYGIAAMALGIAVIVASWLPARRTARGNPLEALRTD